jgi:HK97 family phage major capsid protein
VYIDNGEPKMEKRELELRGLEAYLRGQDCEELRAMDTTTQGAIVPTHLHSEIIEKLDEVAPLFARVPKLTPVGGNLEILREKEVGMAGFVGEGADIAELNSSFEKVRLEQRRCGAFTKISQHLMNDAGIDIATVCKNNLFKALGKAMDRAMINGTVASEQFEGLVNAKGALVEGTITPELFIDMMNAMPVEL